MYPLNGLNSAFQPKWAQPTTLPTVQVPQFTTDQVNPMWAKWLDAAGASNPGGIRMDPRGMGTQQNQAIQGLQAQNDQGLEAWQNTIPGLSKRLKELNA